MYSILEEGNVNRLREMVQELAKSNSESEQSEHEPFEPNEELLRFAPKLTQNRLQAVIDEAQSKFPFKDSFLSYLREKKRGVASVAWAAGGGLMGAAGSERSEALEKSGKGGKRY